ncbi:IS3 family transposase [Dyadobacter sp. CY326]|uniref:IS3 family transposase n=1 Tax=Dyadobacter sp. CY326 TaxID=2907300 RepID=UPI0038D43AF4
MRKGKRQQEHQELSLHVRKVFEENKACYGSPRITVELQAKGFRVSRPRVARELRKIGLKSIVRKKYGIQTTDSNHIYQVSENHLNKDFIAEKLGEKWVSDLTAAAAAYIKEKAGLILQQYLILQIVR